MKMAIKSKHPVESRMFKLSAKPRDACSLRRTALSRGSPEPEASFVVTEDLQSKRFLPAGKSFTFPVARGRLLITARLADWKQQPRPKQAGQRPLVHQQRMKDHQHLDSDTRRVSISEPNRP